MRLYHFTDPANVLLISGQGLKPQASDDGAILTAGMPVVWLTRQSSNELTQDDVTYLTSAGIPAEVGGLAFGGTARISVRLNSNDKKLKRYSDVYRKLRKIGLPLPLPPTVIEDWFVYLGVIPAARIDTALPAQQMLECLDHHIATHPHADARETFKAVRLNVAALPEGGTARFTI